MIGIVITTESMNRLVEKIQSGKCNQYIKEYGVVTIGICAYYAGIRIGSSLGIVKTNIYNIYLNLIKSYI